MFPVCKTLRNLNPSPAMFMRFFPFTATFASGLLLSWVGMFGDVSAIATPSSRVVSPQIARVELSNGEISITRNEDESYTARLRLNASPEEVWNVIADYNSFSQFLPNIISSDTLETEGNRYVVEQVSEQRVLFFNVRSRIRLEHLETENQRIDFRLIEGDLAQLEGAWTIEPTEDGDSLLLTQTVRVEPAAGTPESVFYDIFERSLANTLNAIHDEVLRRQAEMLSLENPV